MITTKKKVMMLAAVVVVIAGGLFASQYTVEEDLALPKIEAKYVNKLNKLPDFAKIADVKEKKAAFFTTLYPIIEEENKRVLKKRNALVVLQDVPIELLQPKQITWIQDVAKYYKVKAEVVDGSTFTQLLNRVDIIPPSLALTQAAIESGWGSSRFSRQGNNLFGQWCFSKGCGMVPSSRDSDKAHEVAKFSSVNAAVRAYIKNLNTNAAYKTLRDKRATLRKKNGEVTGISLAQTLTKYSEEREKYVVKVTQFINQNNLQRFNKQFKESLLIVSSQ